MVGHHGNYRHGHATKGKISPEYRTWNSIITRCFNQKDKSYVDYGGRGITMCDRWRYSFIAFFEDMGPRPEGASIDRIDGNGNYEPGNCRWADLITQSRNKRNVRQFTVNGRSVSAIEIAKGLGFKGGTQSIVKRLRRGWSLTKSTRTPAMKHASKITEREVIQIRILWANGCPQTAISKAFGISGGHVSGIVSHKFWKETADGLSA